MPGQDVGMEGLCMARQWMRLETGRSLYCVNGRARAGVRILEAGGQGSPHDV